MVLRHFNLQEQPFGVTPDPKYLFANTTYREAMSSILYGIEAGLGFITLTGMPGTGKTTILFEAMRRLKESPHVAFLFQTIMTPADLVRALLIELGVRDVQGSLVEMQAQLNELLVAQSSTGKSLLVLIDEVQNFNEPVLETLRMLSNFETPRRKLIQFVLSGQPEFERRLALSQLVQLRQRISIFARLKPLSGTDTIAYIQHRIEVSRCGGQRPIFSGSALNMIAQHSEGIPRNINNICFNALSLGCAYRRSVVDSDIVREVLADLNIKCLDSPISVPKDDNKISIVEVNEKPLARERRRRVYFRSMALAACLAVLVSCLLGILRFGGFSAESSAHRDSSAIPSSEQTPAVAILPSSPTNTVQTRSVQIHEGESLSKLCSETFGTCRPEDLRQMIRMNPGIRNPDHIEPGQKISIPIPSPVP